MEQLSTHASAWDCISLPFVFVACPTKSTSFGSWPPCTGPHCCRMLAWPQPKTLEQNALNEPISNRFKKLHHAEPCPTVHGSSML